MGEPWDLEPEEFIRFIIDHEFDGDLAAFQAPVEAPVEAHAPSTGAEGDGELKFFDDVTVGRRSRARAKRKQRQQAAASKCADGADGANGANGADGADGAGSVVKGKRARTTTNTHTHTHTHTRTRTRTRGSRLLADAPATALLLHNTELPDLDDPAMMIGTLFRSKFERSAFDMNERQQLIKQLPSSFNSKYGIHMDRGDGKAVKVSHVNFSTITMSCTLSHETPMVRQDAFEKHLLTDEAVQRFNMDYLGKQPSVSYKKFSNSVILKVPDSKPRNIKSIKFFYPAAMLHLTGCLDMDEFFKMCDYSRRLLAIMNRRSPDKPPYVLKDMSVYMINSNFFVGFKLNLANVHTAFIAWINGLPESRLHSAVPGVSGVVQFEADTHAGVRFSTADSQYFKCWANFFESGHVLLGGNSATGIRDIFCQVLKFVHIFHEYIRKDALRTTDNIDDSINICLGRMCNQHAFSL